MIEAQTRHMILKEEQCSHDDWKQHCHCVRAAKYLAFERSKEIMKIQGGIKPHVVIIQKAVECHPIDVKIYYLHGIGERENLWVPGYGVR